MKAISCIVFVLFSLGEIDFCYSQKEANNWYFGGGYSTIPPYAPIGNCVGLNFDMATPTALFDGAMVTVEGCATISDKKTGKLLFYTDGSTVYDATHAPMPNGTGLQGSYSSTQSGVIVPLPDSDSLYYVFSVDAQAGAEYYSSGQGGVQYSIVNMSLNGGLGDVISTSKNIPLITPTSEKLAAIKHCNNKDIWIVTHEWNSNNFYTYLLTSAGLNLNSITPAGAVHTGPDNFNANSLGYLKFSPNGKMLASANYSLNEALEIFNFDNSTGDISLLASVTNTDFSGDFPYGVSFSLDNSKLYVSVVSVILGSLTVASTIFQFDVSSKVAPQIVSSMVQIATSEDIYSAIQIAPNGKMYVARSTDYFLAEIANPNATGIACNFTHDGVNVSGDVKRFCSAGLPNFVEDYLVPPFDFSYSFVSCSNAVQFTASTYETEVSWNFGDPSSNNNDTVANVALHEYPSPGTYTVSISVPNTCGYSYSKQITIPNVDASTPTVNCLDTTPKVLDAGIGFETYQWSDGSSSQTLQVQEAGLYIYTVSYEDCSWTNTIDLKASCELKIPNIITANNDGKNDYFEIEGLNEQGWLLSLYNRWGTLVDEYANYTNDWNADGLPDGVYFYALSKDDKSHSGFVTVIR